VSFVQDQLGKDIKRNGMGWTCSKNGDWTCMTDTAKCYVGALYHAKYYHKYVKYPLFLADFN
jgi:hypothetical protein